MKTTISGSTLKIIAIITMLLDHIAATILNQILVNNGMNSILISENSAIIDSWINENPLFLIMMSMRFIGRLAFPIFCFLLVEGFYNTKNVWKYLRRLCLFAIISEIPFDLAIYGHITIFQYQNVFFTLIISLLVLIALKYINDNNLKGAFILDLIVITLGFILAELLHTDYAGIGVLVVVSIYMVYRYYKNGKYKITFAMCVACTLLCFIDPIEIGAYLSIPIIALYNGKRGLNMKYIFYIFYPIHLFLLWLIGIFI